MIRASRLRGLLRTAGLMAFCVVGGSALFQVSAMSQSRQPPARPPSAQREAQLLVRQGRQIFRFDDFGDAAFWSGALQLHRAIEGSAHGGVGPGVSPKTALSVGLKVDVKALPRAVRRALRAGKVNLNSQATTLALLKLNAVVGIKAKFNRAGTLRSIGLTCAVCHSTVNNSFGPGIGARLDG